MRRLVVEHCAGWILAVGALGAGIAGALWTQSSSRRVELLGGLVHGPSVGAALVAVAALAIWAALPATRAERMPSAGARLALHMTSSAVCLGRTAIIGAFLTIVGVALLNPIVAPKTVVLIDYDSPLHDGMHDDQLLERALEQWRAFAPHVESGDRALDDLMERGAAQEIRHGVFRRLRELPKIAKRLDEVEANFRGHERGRIIVVSTRRPTPASGFGRRPSETRYQWICVVPLAGSGRTAPQVRRVRLPNDFVVGRGARVTISLPPEVEPDDVEVRLDGTPLSSAGAVELQGLRCVGFEGEVPLPETSVSLEVLVAGVVRAEETYELRSGRVRIHDAVGGTRLFPTIEASFDGRPFLAADASVAEVTWIGAVEAAPAGAAVRIIEGTRVAGGDDAGLAAAPAYAASAYGRSDVWFDAGGEGLPRWEASLAGTPLIHLVDGHGVRHDVLVEERPGVVALAVPPADVRAVLSTRHQAVLADLLVVATGLAMRSQSGDRRAPVMLRDYDPTSAASAPLVLGPAERASSIPVQALRLLAIDRPNRGYTPLNSIRSELMLVAIAVVLLAASTSAVAAVALSNQRAQTQFMPSLPEPR